MGVLDTFFLLFEADASKLDKGLEDTRKKGKQTAEEMKVVDKAAEKMGESFRESIKELLGAAAAALALHSMTEAMLEAAHAADELNDAANRMGESIEMLGIWGDLTKKNGGSTQGFIASLEALDRNLASIEVTGKSRAAPFLKELGIDLDSAAYKGKSAAELLLPLADAFKDLDKQKSLAMGQRLGFDQATIMTLQAGRREVEELIEKEKELGVITKKQGEIADAYGDQMDDTRHAFRSLWLSVAEVVLPVLTKVMKGFEMVATFARKHSDFVVGLMIALGVAIGTYVLPPLAAMAVEAAIAFAPFLLVGAAIAALATTFALLYDDVMNFLDGNDSLIGQLLEKWPVLGVIIEKVTDFVKGLGDVFAWTFNTVSDVISIAIELFKRFVGWIVETIHNSKFLTAIVNGVTSAFQLLGDVAGMIWDGIVTDVENFIELIKAAFNIVKSIASAITSGLGMAKEALGIGGATSTGVAAGQAALGAAAGSPLASQTSNSINTRSSNKVVNVGQVTVQTQATDAAGIARGIGGAMSTQMRQASANFDDGVAA